VNDKVAEAYALKYTLDLWDLFCDEDMPAALKTLMLLVKEVDRDCRHACVDTLSESDTIFHTSKIINVEYEPRKDKS
jgi:hypothetical protein